MGGAGNYTKGGGYVSEGMGEVSSKGTHTVGGQRIPRTDSERRRRRRRREAASLYVRCSVRWWAEDAKTQSTWTGPRGRAHAAAQHAPSRANP